MEYSVRVTFKDVNGRKHVEDQVADIGVLVGLSYIDRKGLHEVAESLKAMSDHMKRWTQGQSGLRVFTQDYERYAWRSGYLIRHPRLLPRLWQVLVKKVAGVDLHPREMRRRARERRRRR